MAIIVVVGRRARVEQRAARIILLAQLMLDEVLPPVSRLDLITPGNLQLVGPRVAPAVMGHGVVELEDHERATELVVGLFPFFRRLLDIHGPEVDVDSVRHAIEVDRELEILHRLLKLGKGLTFDGIGAVVMLPILDVLLEIVVAVTSAPIDLVVGVQSAPPGLVHCVYSEDTSGPWLLLAGRIIILCGIGSNQVR